MSIDQREASRTASQRSIVDLLAKADVETGGNRPWDIQINDARFFDRVLSGGSLGLGESYVDGDWECARLDEFFARVLRHRLDESIKPWGSYVDAFKAWLFNLQNPSRAFQVAKYHYDIDNELYRLMLDRRMIYSCGYWHHASTLDEAQYNKLDLVCRKLDLRPGMKVLDIGCGWGGAAHFAAEHYGVEVVGITVSEEQARLARSLCRHLPIEIRLQDYRNLNEKFDRIFSIGMFEHVGYKNYATFIRKVRDCLKEDGLFLLHTIGNNISARHTDPWIARYVFPNSLIPSAKQITRAAERSLVLEDWHSFGQYYDQTLMAWFANFKKNWNVLKKRYDGRFYRTWKYYLLSSAGAFRARSLQLWQIVFSLDGVPGGYYPVRYVGSSSEDMRYRETV